MPVFPNRTVTNGNLVQYSSASQWGKRRHPTATGHHLQHDVRGFTGFVTLGQHARRIEELRVNIQMVLRDRIGKQDLILGF